MKTTKEILDILDTQNETDYNDAEYNQVVIEKGLLYAAFVHGYRVAEHEFDHKLDAIYAEANQGHLRMILHRDSDEEIIGRYSKIIELSRGSHETI